MITLKELKEMIEQEIEESGGDMCVQLRDHNGETILDPELGHGTLGRVQFVHFREQS